MTVIIKKRTRASQESQSRTFCLSSIREEPLSASPNTRGASPFASLNFSGGSSSVPPAARQTSPKLMQLAQFSDQREQRQVHRNDHAANDHAQNHNQEWLHSGQQVLHGSIHFFFIEVRNLLEHRVNGSGLFAHANHLRDHAGEYARFLQRLGERPAS